jgi:hypothetical protein
MSKHLFFKYADNLTEKILKKFPAEKSVFVFPSKRSKKEGIRCFQEMRGFSDNLFRTMEEFKESLFVTEAALLREERRNIALYHSLTAGQKKELKIENYLQFIGFAADFFSFWEEFSEEEIEPEGCLATFSASGEELLDWQTGLYGSMLTIRQNYLNFLNDERENSLTDRIFLYRDGNLTFEYYEGYEHFIFVNQHYYTKLENRLLRSLEERGFGVTVCYQLPEAYVDEKENRLKESRSFPVFDPKERKTEAVEIYIAQNDFSLYRKLLELLNEKPELHEIFDSRFYQTSYPCFLSPTAFRGVDKEPMLNCSISVFLFCLAELLESIFTEPGKRRELIPLITLKEILAEEIFFSYFEPERENREIILSLLDEYLRQNIRYFDTGLKFFDFSRTRKGAGEIKILKGCLEKIRDLLAQLEGIASIGSFVSLIDREGGIALNRLLTDNERKFSDIPETFYTALADFSHIEELRIIDNGKFWQEGRKTNRFTVVSGILQLLLLYLRPKRCKWFYEGEQNRRDISSPADSRNLSCEECAVLNVTEGILPRARVTPFLFTEAQRQKLGLKTYEDIRNREKYYFFRLLLSSRRVYLFAQRNTTRNTEISSFIEELKLILGKEKEISITETEISDEGYADFYRQGVKPESSYLADRKVLQDPAFYSLPYEQDQDLKKRYLKLSYSSYSLLKDSPFSYYLKNICRINEEYEHRPFSPLLTGTIAHQIINRVWQILPKPEKGDTACYLKELPAQVGGILDKDRDNVLNSEDLYFRIPHTYNYQYFKEVFLPIVEEGIVNFFTRLEKMVSHNASYLRFFSEFPASEGRLPLLRQLADTEETDPGFDVYLRGRADLIISEQDEKGKEIFKTIVDYKTGKLNRPKDLMTQLLIYELIYHYLFSEPGKPLPPLKESIYERGGISSYIYSLSEHSLKEFSSLLPKKDKAEKTEDFLKELVSLLETITHNGWAGSGPKPVFFLFPEIVRLDLLRKYLSAEKLQYCRGGE